MSSKNTFPVLPVLSFWAEIQAELPSSLLSSAMIRKSPFLKDRMAGSSGKQKKAGLFRLDSPRKCKGITTWKTRELCFEGLLAVGSD